MKKSLIILALGIACMTAGVAHAADTCVTANGLNGIMDPQFGCLPSGSDGFVALAPIPGLTDASATSVVNAASLAQFFNRLYLYLIGLAAALAIIEIIWGGLEIATKDSVIKQGDGRHRIEQALYGLALILAPTLVFSIINPRILNLSINLEPLDIHTATTPTTDTELPSVPTPSTGCISSINSTAYLRSAVCASNSAAEGYPCGPETPEKIVRCATNNTQDECTRVLVYCGKSIALPYYQYLSIAISPNLVGSPLVMPDKQAAETEFKNGCISSVGKVTFVKNLSFARWIASYGGNLPVGLSCPSGTGLTYNPQQYGGVSCFEQKLSCVPS